MIGAELLGYNLMQFKDYSNKNDKMIRDIDGMFLSHFNLDVNVLQDEICLGDECQFLKRFYHQDEYNNKIIMLSEYYQYHKELPRIFQKNISDIIQNYYQDIRSLEYKYVTKKMKQDPQTDRPHRPQPLKPAERLIKNIQLSYYNFQNKNSKKVNKNCSKQNKIIAHKNKKSMPELIFSEQLRSEQNKYQDLKKTANFRSALPPPHPNKSKESNKIGMKVKSKEVLNKCSLNNSGQSHKNLSRSKSKSNFNVVHAQSIPKRNSAKPLQQIVLNKNEKIKSNPTSLQKATSSKNFLKKQQTKKGGKFMMESVDKKLGSGIKNMFKKVMQTKKLIKLTK